MLPQSKAVIALLPTSTTNGGTATGNAIDTMGADFASIDVFATTADVVSNTLSVLRLQEADVTNASSFATVAVSGTDFTLATNAYTSTAGQNIWKMNVDTRGRKRYLRVLASPQTTMTLSAIANLHRMSEAPINAAKANVLNLVAL